MHLTKTFPPFLQKQAPKETSLVYVTSGLALVPIVYCPNYCASKAALHHVCLAVMKEAKFNVKIIELLPRTVLTELCDDKRQLELKTKGGRLGMRLIDLVEEAWEGLNSSENEQVRVGKVPGMGLYAFNGNRNGSRR
ncbi:uncharacterized protein MYCFIDRAFT_84907 [Pseudocercospora fijiensis CIRAD86]|uniref:Uncharacterized protein n=1 Tax=Pseudocercospora fijiensis (strain CIRAD86) TaxID=383855 RepID=M2ZW60_PSEFD|nr:uncharacterized protein MYCFIDRAFT_84907 [Pseudocercospora fijiensis CIRAD86]EME83239.1 hypothetical protein MYCFIDRAFT_84907 [Pseudocercospora fijiensis CIRAD86]